MVGYLSSCRNRSPDANLAGGGSIAATMEQAAGTAEVTATDSTGERRCRNIATRQNRLTSSGLIQALGFTEIVLDANGCCLTNSPFREDKHTSFSIYENGTKMEGPRNRRSR